MHSVISDALVQNESIEDRIIAIQERKSAIIRAANGTGKDEGGSIKDFETLFEL